MDSPLKKLLVLLRHAKSDWDAPGGALTSDFDRPLSTRGERDIGLMAKWLSAHLPVQSLIVTSPAARALQTARVLQKSLFDAKLVTESSLYLASARVLRKIAEQSRADCLVIVGHNPGLEELLVELEPKLGGDNAYRKLMPTSAAYGFEVDDKLSDAKDKTSLIFHQRPKNLR